jgi:hypothetical protein
MNSKKQFDNLNRELMKNLIPDKSTAIFGNSFVNTSDEIFNKSFEEIKNDVIIEILEHHEFLTELESIKYNLNLE